MIWNIAEARKKYSDAEIIEMYNEVKSLRKLSAIIDIERRVLGEILKENGIERDKFITKRIYDKYDNNKYHTDDERTYYVAIDKNDESVVFKDANNKSGIISTY